MRVHLQLQALRDHLAAEGRDGAGHVFGIDIIALGGIAKFSAIEPIEGHDIKHING